MQSSNPILKRYEPKNGAAVASASGSATPPSTFDTVVDGGGARITINDVIIKCGVLFVVTVVFAVVGWNLAPSAPWIIFVGLIGGFALAMANSFMRNVNPILVLLYGAFEGLMLGGISTWYNTYAEASEYNGIVLQAVVATMTTFGIMLVLYLTGVIKVTRKFASVMIVALVSYMVLGIASFIAALFGVGGGWGFYGVGGLGLIICVAGVLLAAFFLLLDFEAINQGIAMGLPERESWRMAFGLLVTLVWLYLEFLRLLAIFSRN